VVRKKRVDLNKGAFVMVEKKRTAAVIEDFDSFWEAPDDIEAGYRKFGIFYRHNYLQYFPSDKASNILVVSCGPGYMVQLLNQSGYSNVLGIDSIAEKIEPALKKKLNCQHASAFEFLESTEDFFDAIFCEQEINHLTKTEIYEFLTLCHKKLKDGGTLIIHSLNGANPLVGIENLALNFDHFNIFTEKSLVQLLEHLQYREIRPIPLNLYVFFKNPVNYVGIAINAVLNTVFRLMYTFYGKKNKIFFQEDRCG
jgi:2-polyprenyl-3-methyl-5-hydroxy-6-metoxy-1,4-benzoquinol methylase